MTIMAMDVLFHYGYECVCRDVKTGAKPGGAIERIPLPKTCELTLFTMIAYNSENSIRNTRLFCHPLFCHRSVVKYHLSLIVNP